VWPKAPVCSVDLTVPPRPLHPLTKLRGSIKNFPLLAEWVKVAVCQPACILRDFKHLQTIRHVLGTSDTIVIWSGVRSCGRVAEGGGLLNHCTV
jgi:hypothetical protein